MRGQTHRQQWAIVYFDHIMKRWREYECGSAATMIVQFVMDKYVRTGVTRLLAPGGIIAGEHNTKRQSAKPIARTGQIRGSGLVGLPGYPFLTLCDPHARKSARK